MLPAFLWNDDNRTSHLCMIRTTIRGTEQRVCTSRREGERDTADCAGHDWNGFLGSDLHGVQQVHAGGHDGQCRAHRDGKRERLIALLAAVEYPFFGDDTQDIGRFAGFEEAAVAEFRFVEAQWVNSAWGYRSLDEPNCKKSRRQREGESPHNGCDYFPDRD